MTKYLSLQFYYKKLVFPDNFILNWKIKTKTLNRCVQPKNSLKNLVYLFAYEKERDSP